ncbi:hypothetical protein ACFVOK_18565 [Streptomyces sp. NPDC057798]|uniref:hypothetical protein n=1 Tax=Streptomyces sp. NPDC057798 TaxID=3346252 RepID=UPI00368C8B27
MYDETQNEEDGKALGRFYLYNHIIEKDARRRLPERAHCPRWLMLFWAAAAGESACPIASHLSD